MSDVHHWGLGQPAEYLDSFPAPAPSERPARRQTADVHDVRDIPQPSPPPDIPALTDLLDLPDLPDLPNFPDIPHIRDDPDAPDLPVDPSACGTDRPAAHITPAGANWLASAGATPYAVLYQWDACPDAPGVLPCGTVFDVISAPALYGRRILERLWSAGPGSGPVAAHHGRILLFAAPGSAQRLPALLTWEEWNGTGNCGTGGTAEGAFSSLLCHGIGDTVTVPPPRPAPAPALGSVPGTRWLVAPAVRHPWLPGPEVLLWACVRAARPRARPSAQVRGMVKSRGQH